MPLIFEAPVAKCMSCKYFPIEKSTEEAAKAKSAFRYEKCMN
jgi:hypothetical protein